MKFVPGVGSVAGGVVAAAAAAALTTALGELYVAVLARLFAASEGEPPSPEAIAQEFKNRLAAKRDS